MFTATPCTSINSFNIISLLASNSAANPLKAALISESADFANSCAQNKAM